jgi:hypothetical protein
MKILDLCLPHSRREHAIDGPRDIVPARSAKAIGRKSACNDMPTGFPKL